MSSRRESWRRREFIGGRTLIGGVGLLARPFASDAQQAPNVARIGFLGATSPSGWGSRVEAFRLGLRDLGYVEGKNVVIECRWADEHYRGWRPNCFASKSISW